MSTYLIESMNGDKVIVTTPDESITVSRRGAEWECRIKQQLRDGVWDYQYSGTPLAMWKCDSPEKAITLAEWIDVHGDNIYYDAPAAPEQDDPAFGLKMTRCERWDARRFRKMGSPTLMFRNGPPRGPKEQQ